MSLDGQEIKESLKKNPAYDSLWNDILDVVKEEVSLVAINTWLKEIRLSEVTKKLALLYIENSFQRDIVLSRYTDVLKRAFKSVTGSDIDIYFVGDTSKVYDVNLKKEIPYDEFYKENMRGEDENLSFVRTEEKPAFDYEYTFDTFIVGSSNNFAYVAAKKIASQPGTSYNPLFIYGGSGLGKTHLLHAVMYETKKSFSDFNIIYLRGDDFTNQFILAMQKGDLSEFKKKYRAADMLLVDDIQFVAGKETTQEEFFHTFNALYEGKKQIVLTSDRPPKELASLEERLVSRFESGLLVDIQPPDFETRIAIIKRKAFVLGVDIPENVLLFVANNVKTNIRQLEGAVKKLKAFSQLTGVAIDLNIAQVAVRDMFSQIRQNIVTVDDIIAEISKFYNISVDDIKSKKRTSEVAFARQVAMYIAREMTDLSLPAIGDHFGRDHTTVIHSINKVEEEIGKNLRLKQIIFDLIKNIKGNT